MIVERFWNKVKKDVPGGCWEWIGATQRRGYGTVRVAGKSVLAHRVAWELAHGPVPDGMEIDHLCRNPRCVNPDHMEPVTHHENVLRGRAPATMNARKTHCKRGHELVGYNLRIYRRSSGHQMRVCRTCARERHASVLSSDSK